LPDFKPDSRWIARVLNLTVDEVNLALARLLRLGLLEMVSADEWVDKSGEEITTLEDFSQAAVQQLAQQVRNSSRLAVSQGAHVVSESTTRMAIRKDCLEEARQAIAMMEQKLTECLATADDQDDVYQLEIRVYPVTDLNKSGGQ
jgi:uncharacterized protein (TIGR02147 family)